MSPIDWRPKINTLQESLIEEQTRLKDLQAKRVQAATLYVPQWQPSEVGMTGEPSPYPVATPSKTPEWMPPQTQAITVNIPSTQQMGVAAPVIPEVPVAAPETKGYEMPKVWTEQAMEAVGTGISKVPILPKALEAVAPVFGWIHEKLELPFASFITSPFSPDLPWRAGETWIEHKKREYQSWEAPTYVKGIAEFAMPLWWMPWFGWAARGAKSLGVGSKAAAQMAKIGNTIRVSDAGFLASSEILGETLFKAGRLTKAMEHIPVVNKIVEMVGGPGVFIDAKTAGRVSLAVKAGEKLVKADNLTWTKMELVKMGWVNNMRDGVSRLLVPKLQVIEAAGKGIARLLGMDSKGVISKIVPKAKGGSPYLYDVLEGAMKDPKKYKFLNDEVKRYVETLSEVIDDIWKLGKQEGLRMPKERLLHRIVKGKLNPDTKKFEATEFGSLFEKTRVHKTMREGVEAAEKIGSRLEYGLDISESVTSTINHYMREIAKKRFNKALHPLGKTPKAKALEAMGEEGAELTSMRILQKAGGKIENPARYTKLINEEADILKHYAGRQVIGEDLAKFVMHPSFKNKLFPTPVVKTVEKLLGDDGQKWLTAAAGLSGTSRMLVAAMDLSAPFIQGLAVAGRNPVAWVGMVKKNLEFFIKPANFYKYMTDPKVMAIAAERISSGGSGSTFEFFKALGPTQRVLGKIPKVGSPLRRAIGQTYGRAEAAFTGGGEAARNYMWQALRKNVLTPEGVLDKAKAMNLARTIDRMTGVMSTEALTIGRTQMDFENAFVFFAPRYTRAGLSFVKDTLKGGMAGAEARKSLGALMAGGMSMYYGVATALGQQPNLNPNSGRFMTIKIGDSHVGIGGIMVALMRFGYDVAATVVEDPINLVKPLSEGHLNRWDNPFIRFLYTRTAPLTSTVMGTVVEQANYFGEPFENVGDWAKFMADKVTPIAVQGVIDDPQPHVAFTEFAGLRVFPKSPWELMDEERDRVAIREFGQPYENLNDLEQTKVDKFDTIRSLQKDVDAQSVTRGDAVSVGFLNRQRERDAARQVYEEKLWGYQKAYDAGEINGFDFKELMSNEGYGLGTTYDHIDAQPEYKDVMEVFKKPRDIKDKHLEDIAYSEFMSMMYQTGKNGRSIFEDQYGIFQFDKYNAFIEEFRAKYGEENYQYVLARKAERDAELPPLAKELQKAKLILKPYWQVADDVARIFKSKRFAESKAGQRLITRLRNVKKIRNPEIRKALAMFYTR